MRRRVTLTSLLIMGALALSVLAQSAAAQIAIELPAPRMHGGLPLMEAFVKRQSIRAYEARPLARETLSNLLWAAFGVNRRDGGGRTAPSTRGAREIDIYVATSEAVWFYDPTAHALRHVMDGDIRAATGRQPFPATASVVLIYAADRARMVDIPAQEHMLSAHVDAAFIAQNVYLFAASEGLGTVVLGNVDKAELAKTMRLGENKILTFTQPVGYPK